MDLKIIETELKFIQERFGEIEERLELYERHLTNLIVAAKPLVQSRNDDAILEQDLDRLAIALAYIAKPH